MPAKRLDKEELLHCLESIQPGLSPREFIEQSSCFIFKEGYAYTYNDEVACKMRVKSLDPSFMGAIPASPLLAILKKIPDEDLDFEFDGAEVVMSGKGRRVGLRYEKEIGLPIESVETPEKWRPIHEEFTEAVGVAQQCAGTDDSFFTITCVHIHPEWVEACDNVQLCRWKIKTGVKKSFLVRRDAIKHIASLGITSVSETANWVHFKNSEDLVLSCRRYEEDFLDLGEHLKVIGTKLVLPKSLGEVAEKAQVFSSEKLNEEDDTVQVKISPGKLRIKGQGVYGWFSETKKVNYDGPVMSFLAAPKILVDLVARHNECLIGTDKLKVDTGNYVYVACLEVGDRNDQQQSGSS